MKLLPILLDNDEPSSSGGIKTELDFMALNGLYGRDQEMELLTRIYNSISGDQGLSTQVILVHGSGGTGKTALCRFFERKISPIYVEGKFNPISNEPYSAFSQAFAKLSDLFVNRSVEEVARIRGSYRSQEDRGVEVLTREIRGHGADLGTVHSESSDSPRATLLERIHSSPLQRRAISLGVQALTKQPKRTNASPQTTQQPNRRTMSVDSMFLLGKTMGTDTTKEDVLDTNGSICSIVPGIERLIQANVSSQNNSIGCVKHSFRSFLRAICSPSNPIVVCLRGLQWADESSVLLFQYLVEDSSCRGLMIIGCYRDDEELLPSTRDAMHDMARRDNVTVMRIENLNQSDLHRMISDVTLTSANQSKSEKLAEVVYQKTNGNPFFAIEFLRMLVRENYMWMNFASYEFEFDVAKIRAQTGVADNVADLISSKISALPVTAQNALRVGACLGSHCDLAVIAAILGSSLTEVKYCLLRAVRQRLIEISEIDSFKWAHDKIQQSAYDLIPIGSERPAFHLNVGNVLKELSGSSHKEWILFLAAENLNRAIDLISDDHMKMELILLNIKAAEQAMQKSALVSASDFFMMSLKLMGDTDFRWRNHYDLSLRVCIQLADVECILGRFQKCEDLIQQVLKSAKCLEDKIPAYFSQVEFLTAQGNLIEAVNLVIQTLKLLGFSIRRKPTKLHVRVEFISVLRMLRVMTTEEVLQLPPLKDPKKVAAMQLLSRTASRAWLTGQQELAVLLCLRGIRITCRHGQTCASPYSFAALGAICGYLFDYDAANRFGELSLALVAHHGNLEQAARPLFLYLTYIHHLQNPLQQCLDPLINAYRRGLNSGDVDIAHDCIANYVAAYVLVGLPLPVIEDDARKFVEQLMSFNRTRSLWLLRIYWQYVLCFIGDYSLSPVALSGTAMVEGEALVELTETKQYASLRSLWTMRMMLAYHFGDFELAAAMGKLIFDSGTSKGHFMVYAQYGYMALTMFAKARNAPHRKRKAFLRNGIKLMDVIRDMLNAKNLNVLHLYQLCVAERAALDPSADIEDVKILYGKAIAIASRTGILHIAAVATERAGLFFQDRGDQVGAGLYFRRAVDLYDTWGAHAKVSHIQAKYDLSSKDVDKNLPSRGCLARNKFRGDEANNHKTVFLSTW